MATAQMAATVPATQSMVRRAMDQRKVRWEKTTMTVKNRSESGRLNAGHAGLGVFLP